MRSSISKSADRLFTHAAVPQPADLRSDSLDFSALTTFNREAVLSKFLPTFDEFRGKTKRNFSAPPPPPSASTAAAGARNGSSAEADTGSSSDPSSSVSKPRLSGQALASDREYRILQATQQETSAQRLQQYRRRAREEERRNRHSRAEQAKLDGYWDAASRIVRHKRYPYVVHSARHQRVQTDKARRSKVSSAARSEGKRRATSALIADPPLSLIKEGLQAGYTDELDDALNITQHVPESYMQLLRGVFASHDDDDDGLLSIEQLRRALLGLGLSDTPDTLERFVKLSKHKPKVDVVSFVYVLAMLGDYGNGNGSTSGGHNDAGRPNDCAEEVLEVLETVQAWISEANGDNAGQGKHATKGGSADNNASKNASIDTAMLRHILQVQTGTELSPNEIEDFMIYAEGMLYDKQSELRTVAQRKRGALRATPEEQFTADAESDPRLFNVDKLIHHLVDFRGTHSPYR